LGNIVLLNRWCFRYSHAARLNKGKKKGWQSDKPPGMDKKDDRFEKKGGKSEKKQKKAKFKSEMESEFEKHDDVLGNEKGKSKKK